MRKLLPALVLGLAFWPVWYWFVARYSDGSDEPLGVLALLTALSFVFVTDAAGSTWRSPRRMNLLFMSALALMVIYVLSFFWAPQALDGLIAILCVATCLCAMFSNMKVNAGTAGLLMLSLPVVATANFYLGYPLRLLATNACTVLLRLSGFAVHSRGTELLLGSKVVEVDAPCSGVKMLWFTVYLACAVAAFYKMSWSRTAKLVFLAVGAALIANVVRVNALFVMDATSLFDQLGGFEDVAHQAVGVVSFCLGALGVLAAARLQTRRRRLAETHASVLDADSSALQQNHPRSTPGARWSRANQWQRIPQRLRVAFYTLCLLAAVLPFAAPSQVPAESAFAFPGWPQQFAGRPLTAVEMSAKDRQFLSGFPGKVGCFSDGSQLILVRWVTKPTRQLHPSCDCYRAVGYSIKWLPLRINGNGTRWSRYEAVRGTDRLLVSERIYDNNGQNWSDVSSWYWASMFAKSRAPWWVITVVQRTP